MNNKHFDKKNEIKITGVNSSLKFLKDYHSDVIKVYANKQNQSLFQKHSYGHNVIVVTDLELAKLSKSEHHEGVCVLAKKPRVLPVKSKKINPRADETIILLDDVSNPHNIGAIIRTAAHFGVDSIFLKANTNPYSSATIRVSEAGVFAISFFTYESLDEVSNFCKTNKVEIYTTELKDSKSIYDTNFNKNSLIILGAEKNGVSKEAKEIASRFISIPGTGAVESLNVSVACSVILSERYRQLL